MEIVRVRRESRATKVAGAIAALVREGKQVQARGIGAAALNQAIKSVIIARSYLTVDGIDAICIPVFETVHMNGQPVRIVALTVEPR